MVSIVSTSPKIFNLILMSDKNVIIFETYSKLYFPSAFAGWFKLETNECEFNYHTNQNKISTGVYQVHYFIYVCFSSEKLQELKRYRWF